MTYKWLALDLYMTCSCVWLAHTCTVIDKPIAYEWYIASHGFFPELVNNCLATLADDLQMTCNGHGHDSLWLAQHLHIDKWIAHDWHTICINCITSRWLANDMYMTCIWLAHGSQRLGHYLYVTCIWMFASVPVQNLQK